MKSFKSVIAIVGPIIGVISLLLAIYIHFIRNTNAEVRLEILNNSPLVDIKDSFKKLSISYDSINILKENQELRFIIIRIANVGDVDINLTHFDPKNLFGIKVVNGTIIERPTITGSSSEYLKPDILLKENNGIYFEPFLFDKSSSFNIKILALTNNNKPIIITALGKLSGTNPQIIEDYQITNTKKNLIQTVFDGNIWVILLKVLIFTIIGVGIVVIIFLLTESIKKLFFKEEKTKSFGEIHFDEMNAYKELLKQKVLKRILSDEKNELKRAYELLTDYSDVGLNKLYHSLLNKKPDINTDDNLSLKAIQILIEDKFIELKDGNLGYWTSYLLDILRQYFDDQKNNQIFNELINRDQINLLKEN